MSSFVFSKQNYELQSQKDSHRQSAGAEGSERAQDRFGSERAQCRVERSACAAQRVCAALRTHVSLGGGGARSFQYNGGGRGLNFAL